MRKAVCFRARFSFPETGPAAVRHTHEGYRTLFGGKNARGNVSFTADTVGPLTKLFPSISSCNLFSHTMLCNQRLPSWPQSLIEAELFPAIFTFLRLFYIDESGGFASSDRQTLLLRVLLPSIMSLFPVPTAAPPYKTGRFSTSFSSLTGSTARQEPTAAFSRTTITSTPNTAKSPSASTQCLLHAARHETNGASRSLHAELVSGSHRATTSFSVRELRLTGTARRGQRCRWRNRKTTTVKRNKADRSRGRI